jgi:hypothetical protein
LYLNPALALKPVLPFPDVENRKKAQILSDPPVLLFPVPYSLPSFSHRLVFSNCR